MVIVGLVAAYVLAVAIGLAAGSWEAVRVHRRHPALRDTPPSLTRTVVVAFSACAIFAVLAWALGEWNGVYLAGAGVFGAVLLVAWFIWPLVRSLRSEHAARIG
jgi:hypothetical protein